MFNLKYILPLLFATIVSCNTQRTTNDGKSSDTNNSKYEKMEKSAATQIKHQPVDYSTFTADDNGFALKLFDIVCKNEPKENLCISPASASWALSMTANGASGNTLKQMMEILGITNCTPDSLNKRQRALISALISNSEETKLSIANSIWINKPLTVKPTFIKANVTYYDAQVKNLPFDAATLDSINSWCSDNTNGKITSILDKLDEQTMMLLLNALYFKGLWSKPFIKDATTEADFTTADGNTLKVQMMNQTFRTGYFGNDSIQIVSKPFGDGRFEMLFALPAKGLSLSEATTLMGQHYTEWRKRMERGVNVSLALPRFKVEYDTSLKDALKALGMTDAFDKKADFSLISAAPLLINDVVQKCYVKVNENGAEAAAVTAAVMELMSARPAMRKESVVLDRPFIYMITYTEASQSNILFIGKAGAPQE